MVKLDEFRAKLQSGGFRGNQFRVSIPFPAFAIKGDAETSLQFLCIATSIPGQKIAEIAVKFRGQTIKLAGDKEPAADWSTEVYNSKSFDIRATLEAWHNYYIEQDSIAGQNMIPVVDATVEALDKNDNVLRTYTLYNFWPTEIAEIELTQESENKISTFKTTFAYDYWKAI